MLLHLLIYAKVLLHHEELLPQCDKADTLVEVRLYSLRLETFGRLAAEEVNSSHAKSEGKCPQNPENSQADEDNNENVCG